MAPSKAKSRPYGLDEPRGGIRGTTKYLASRRGSREYVGVPTTRYQERWSALLGPMASYQASWQSKQLGGAGRHRGGSLGGRLGCSCFPRTDADGSHSGRRNCIEDPRCWSRDAVCVAPIEPEAQSGRRRRPSQEVTSLLSCSLNAESGRRTRGRPMKAFWCLR